MSLPLGELHCLKIKSKVATQACNACKKRKVKCIGNPCAYCVKKNYICQFNIGKKRGPPKKMRFPKGVEECGTMSAVLLNHIQSSMDVAYRQNNFVDFYFQYIGRPIPKSFKTALLASTDNELNSDLITQLYIVSADVMKFFGNNDLEMQCIEKAHRYASSIFNSDSVESAVSLMMMANYVGRRHPKYSTYMNLANNITSLPCLKTSVEACKAKYSCQVQLVFIDDSLSNTQKYDYIVSKIFSIGEANLIPYTDQGDVVSITSIKIRHMLLLHANYDDNGNEAFIRTVNAPPKLLTAEARAATMMELNRMENVVKTMGQNHSSYILGLYSASHSRFLIEWRSGNTAEALVAAENSMAIYKENKNILGLWFHLGFVSSLNLPYFFQINGMAEKATEILKYFEDSATNNNTKLELRDAWQQLCVSTGITSDMGPVQDLGMSSCEESPSSSPPLSPSLSPPSPTLSPPQSPETLCISQSILQSFEQSISHHVAQPISQIISQHQIIPQQQQQQQQQQQIYQQTIQQIIPQQQQQQQQTIQQQIILPQQMLQYQQNNNMQYFTQTYAQMIPQQNFSQQYDISPSNYNFITTNNTEIPNNTTTTTSTDNTNNTNNNNNNNLINNNENPLRLSQNILYFDHDTLSELLFSPVLPMFTNDNMF